MNCWNGDEEWSSCQGRPGLSANEATMHSRFMKCELKLCIRWGAPSTGGLAATGEWVLFRLWKKDPQLIKIRAVSTHSLAIKSLKALYSETKDRAECISKKKMRRAISTSAISFKQGSQTAKVESKLYVSLQICQKPKEQVSWTREPGFHWGPWCMKDVYFCDRLWVNRRAGIRQD